MNKFILEGRLGRDAEIRETANGGKFLSLTVVENVFENNEKKPYWYDVSCFNYNEKLVQYYKKGSLLFLTGQLTCNLVTRKDGAQDIRRSIKADSIDFPESGKSKDENETSASATHATPQTDQNTNSMYSSRKSVKKEEVPEPVVMTAKASNDELSDLPF